jgi:6-phospho-3-hexuloisomerase
MLISDAFASILEEHGRITTGVDWVAVNRLLIELRSAGRVFVLARGRSELVLKMFAMRLVQLGLSVHVVGDVTTPAIGKDDVLLVASASGETGSVCGLVEKARGLGCRVMGFVGRANNRLGTALDVRVAVNAPSMRDAGQRQFGGSLFEQSVLLLCDAIVVSMLAAEPELADQMSARHANLE